MTCSLGVKLNQIEFKNPVIAASGTFGFGQEYNGIYDVGILGGICTKGLTFEPQGGNTGIRLWETPMGILNSIGMENPGIEAFIRKELPQMKKWNTRIIVNLGGATEEEYLKSVESLNNSNPDMIELNISCPNVRKGCMAFGMNEKGAAEIVRKVKDASRHPVIVKLTPNAENIVRVAVACEEAGADGVSLINTVKAMAVDINEKKAVFENVYAGLSGPAIKPIALRMVHEVYKAVSIPVIGIGGIMNWKDALEFIMAGAHFIQVGTANFVNPEIGKEIVLGMQTYMEKEGIRSLEEIRGII